jgi:CheY-like chemotaxis protein
VLARESWPASAGETFFCLLFRKVREMSDQPGIEKCILIVDDESFIRDFFRDVLQTAGYEVVLAENGKKAMARLQERKVDLVIMDLVMPEQEGVETIQALRRAYPDIKIVAMSGAFGGQFLKTATLLGARATLAKPVAPGEILRLVRDIVSAQ